MPGGVREVVGWGEKGGPKRGEIWEEDFGGGGGWGQH